MVTSEIKTLEKLVKEILEKVKGIGEGSSENYGEAFTQINTKLDTIDERLAVPDAENNLSAELISKVDKLTEKVDENSTNYLKEIEDAFEKYLKSCDQINSVQVDDDKMKDFVSVITNEMMELKAEFEKFNTEFTDVNLNTSMAVSKEIVSLKNHFLALNDTVDKISEKIENINLEETLPPPIATKVSDAVQEAYTTSLNSFKTEIFAVIAKIMDGITKVLDNAKFLEGVELTLGEISHNQQKDKDEILKIIKADLAEENKKLLPQILQIVNSISFQEEAEELKDGLYAVNENLAIVNKNIENGSQSTEQILQTVSDLKTGVDSTREEVKSILKDDLIEKITKIDYTVESLSGNIAKSEMATKISKIDKALSEVSEEFNVLVKGPKEGSEDYLYTLLDLESDISRVRVILDELAHSLKDDRSLAENVTKNISDKISKVNSFIEKTANLYTDPDYKAILTQFDALNNDITSISKRTNKLILTSDDSSERLEKNISDFQKILTKITSSVAGFENSKVLKTLSIRTENIQKIAQASLNSNKAMNEAFVHLASWVDETSEEIKNLKAEISFISDKAELIDTIKNGVERNLQSNETEEAFDALKLEKLLKETNKKIQENTKKIELLEEKLSVASSDETKSMLEFLVSQVQVMNENLSNNKTLNKKIDKMEKQIQKLLSYVEEDEEND